MPGPLEPPHGAAGHTGAGGVSWPVRSDVGPRPPRPDVLAALLCALAGGAAAGQLSLSWSSVVSGVGLLDANGGITGWERYESARTGAGLSAADTITAYSILGTALAGAALLLLALALLLPIDHRPLGILALVVSLGALSAALWWLVRGHQTFNQSVGDLFAHAGPGWYLFLIAGPIGLCGASKALATG